MGLYAPGQMMNDPSHWQISSNSSLSNALKFKLWHDFNLFLAEMKAVTGKDIVEHIMRPAKVIPATLVKVTYAPLLIGKLTLLTDLMKLKEWWMRKQVGKRLIVGEMWVLMEWIELIVLLILFVQMPVCEIPNIAMNFRSAWLWAHLPNLSRCNWKRSLRMRRWPTKVQERCRSKWMARRLLIQIIPV